MGEPTAFGGYESPPSYPPPPSGYPPPPSSYPPPSAYPPPPSGYPPSPSYQSGYPGAPYAGGYAAPKSRTNGLAIGSLVASIVGIPMSFFCFGVLGGLAGIAGVVLGILALNQIKQSGEEGRGLAIAGIVIGGAVLVLALIAGIFLVAYSVNT